MPLTDEVAYGFYRTPAFLDLPCETETWLVHPIVPIGGWVNLYGKPKKARKSYLALGVSWAISSAQPLWLGFPVRQSGPVLYLQADTPHALWRQRVADLSAAGYDYDQVWFASLLTMPFPFNIAEHEEILAQMIAGAEAEADRPIRLIVYDTGRKLHLGDENSSQEMTAFMNALDRVSGRGVAKLLITHDKKGGNNPHGGPRDETDREGGDLMEGARGSTAVAGAVDTVMKMTPKGFLYYQSRAIDEHHKKLTFRHVGGEAGFVWEEEVDPIIEAARQLLVTYKSGSERSLARLFARQFDLEEERARAILRRQKERL